MASKKKDERKIVRWVTVKGKHMPIYADGSFGVGTKDDDIDDESRAIDVNGKKVGVKAKETHAQAIYRQAQEEQGLPVDKKFYQSLGETNAPVGHEKQVYSSKTNSSNDGGKKGQNYTSRRNKSERGWYTGEPDTASLAKANKAYSKKASGDGYSVTPTNLGFVGDYVTTPSGEKYTIIKTGHWKDEYSIYHGNTGYSSKQPTDQKFSSSKDALQWLKDNDTKRKSKADSRKKKK